MMKFLGLALITVTVRLLALLLFPNAFQEDPDAYRALALTLSEYGVFGLTDGRGTAIPTAFRPPLYPWLLSFCVEGNRLLSHRVVLVHLACAVTTSLATYAAARRLMAGAPSASNSRFQRLPSPDALAFVAALLTVVDPILLRQSTELMTETLATAISAGIMLLWTMHCPPFHKASDHEDEAPGNPRIRVLFGLGFLLAGAYLCRPTFLVWAVLIVFAVCVRSWRNGLRDLVVSSSVIALPIVLAVIGWTIRNQRVTGHAVWATTHGGYTLLLANNELFYDYLRDGAWGETWDAEPFFNAYRHRYDDDPKTRAFWRRNWSGSEPAQTSSNEYDDDRRCYEAAKATISRQPWMFWWSCIVRAARLWNPLPYQVADRSTMAIVIVGGFYLLLYIACVITMVRFRRRLLDPKWWSIGLLAFALTGVHSVYWSNLRMRAPITPGVMIVAVCSLATRTDAKSR
ncbi:MAG: hypothetical protein AAGJ83_02420 [Planctomycetota bacterium]